MYRRNERGKVCGVLTDFDLLSWRVDLAKDYMMASQQRTGEPLYMAYRLLEGADPSHLYRHDAESMFYIIAMLATRYEIRGEGKGIQIRQEPVKLPFGQWFNQPSYHSATRRSQAWPPHTTPAGPRAVSNLRRLPRLATSDSQFFLQRHRGKRCA